MLGARRASFEPLKNLAARPFLWLGVPPLAITLAALPMCLGAGLCAWGGHPAWSLTLAVAASLTDFVDGAVARASGQCSRWGSYLETIVDRGVELLLLCQLSVVCGLPATAALGTCMPVSYCKPRLALAIPLDNRDWPGQADHADRMVLIELAWGAALWKVLLAQALLWLLTCVAGYGVLQRLRYAKELIDRSQ